MTPPLCSSDRYADGLAADAAAAGNVLPCWCGHGCWRTVFRARRFGLRRCAACGCYCTDPVPLRTQNESAEFYTEYYARLPLEELAGRPAARDHVPSHFRQVGLRVPALLGVGERALDVGCGDGHFCAELQHAGWPFVAGVDVSRIRIARARQTYPGIRFYDCPLAKTDLAERSVDLAVMDSVVEHLPDPRAVVQEVARFLKPGARLLVLTPNLDSGDFRFLGRRWTGMLAPHVHIFLFTPAALCRLLAECGFEIEASGSLYTERYRVAQFLRRLGSGDFKGALWRAHQEMGALFGRLIRSGPLLWVVARSR